MTTTMTPIIGLTGGIGSGKTTVAGLFAELGAVVVDTDVIAHELTSADGAAMPAIADAFGGVVVLKDGRLDRAAMRRLCFSDPAMRKRLEAILHPLIRVESLARSQRAACADGTPYVLLVVPLLIESGAYRERVGRILLVDCDEAQQIERVMTRGGLSEQEVRAVMAAQASRAERLAAADDILLNNGTCGELRTEILALHRRYTGLGQRVPQDSPGI